LDVHNRCVLEGYGVANFPMAPGLHQLSLHCWKPRTSSLKDQLSETFLGGSVVLKNPHVAASAEDRYKLKTASSGTVNIEVNVVARNFSKFGVQLG
jgi:B9 domain-containing protein 2